MKLIFVMLFTCLLLGCNEDKSIHFSPIMQPGTQFGGDKIPTSSLIEVKNKQELLSLILKHWSFDQLEQYVLNNESTVGYQGITQNNGRIEGTLYDQEAERSSIIDKIWYIGVFEGNRLISMSLVITGQGEEYNIGSYLAEYHLAFE